MTKSDCSKMVQKYVVVWMLAILVIVAIVGLVVTLRGESTGKAIYVSPQLCPSGMTSHPSDSPVLEAKMKAGQKCVKAAYPGWHCCPTYT